MDCLSESIVLDLLDDRLGADERAKVQAHLDECPACCELVAASAKSVLASREAEPGEPLPPLARGAQVGRYLVLAPVGAGAMGVVYAAYDPQLDRKVALKLLRPGTARPDEETRARLLREGQALARLSHPNVVAVYDLGPHRDQVFVAMEFVDGETLDQWLRARPRTWREVLAVMVPAGRGLATAHAAGLVHRDFKPENVLIGRDGRPRVTDFGLARQASPSPGPGPVGADLDLTRTRALVGTPAYMAPEQLRGDPVDARADLYAFCLTLFEALYRQRPFEGATLDALQAAREAERLREVPPGGVPAWLRAALLKGLRAAPADRPASMEELLTLLESDPAARRRRWFAAGAASLAVLGVLGGVVGASGSRVRPCAGAAERVAEAWGPAQRQATREAFLATSAAFAPPAFESSARRLDGYAAEWAAARTEACEATRVRGEQSERLLDLRMACLDQRWRGLAALAALFAKADLKVVENAVAAAAALEPLAGCAPGPGLLERTPLPASPEVRRRLAEIDEGLAAVQAQRDSGRWPQGLEAGEPWLRAARATQHRPLEARAGLLVGDLFDRTGRLAEAEATLTDAVWAAEAGHEDLVGAQAASRLTALVGYRLAREAEGLRWARHATALLERSGGDVATQARLETDLGTLHRGRGRYEEALVHFRAARSLREDRPDDPERASALFGVASVLRDLGRQDEARETLERVLAEQTALVGADHPLVARTLSELGGAEVRLSLLERADGHLRRALAIVEATLGGEHIEIGYAVNRLGNLALAREEPAEALRLFQRTMELGRKTLPADHPEIAMARSNQAIALTRLGRFQAAHEELRLAKAVLEPQQHPFLAQVCAVAAELAAREGRCGEARREAGASLALGERELGPRHAEVAAVLTLLGRIELDCGDPARALGHLERAAELAQPPLELAETRFELARALAATGKRERALELAGLARGFWAGQERLGPVRIKALEAWLAKVAPAK